MIFFTPLLTPLFQLPTLVTLCKIEFGSLCILQWTKVTHCVGVCMLGDPLIPLLCVCVVADG